MQLLLVKRVHDRPCREQRLDRLPLGRRQVSEVRGKRDLEPRIEYRLRAFDRPVAVREFGRCREREEHHAAGEFDAVFHGLVREFGRRLAPPVDAELRDVRTRVMARNVHVLAFFEHDAVIEFGNPQ